MNEVNMSFVLEQFHRELLSAAQSSRTIGELTRLAARIIDEVAERFGGNAGIETEHEGTGCDLSYRRKIFDCVDALGTRKQRRHQMTDIKDDERITVGRRLYGHLECDGAGSTGAIVGDHRLTEFFTQ